MAKRAIIIRVSEDGEVVVEAEGYKGDECLKATELFERALGIPDESKRTFKEEFYQEETGEEHGMYA